MPCGVPKFTWCVAARVKGGGVLPVSVRVEVVIAKIEVESGGGVGEKLEAGFAAVSPVIMVSSGNARSFNV
jgi:hypothetical protein